MYPIDQSVRRLYSVEKFQRKTFFFWDEFQRNAYFRFFWSNMDNSVQMDSKWAMLAYHIAPRAMCQFPGTNQLAYRRPRQVTFPPWLPMKSRVSYRVRLAIRASTRTPLEIISIRPITRPTNKPPQGSSQPIIAIIGMNGVIKLCPCFFNFFALYNPLLQSIRPTI